MDSRYLESCHVGTPFYNPFRTFTSTIGTAVQTRRCPALWTASREGVWEVWSPLRGALRLQGWKIHIGAVARDATGTLSLVTDYCIAREIPFKFLRSHQLLAESNSKSAGRTSSGKFITIYPDDDDVLTNAAYDLGEILAGRPSPYVLSDYRHERGPVYFRYGAFLGLSAIDGRDEPVPSRVDASLRLVPDVRAPYPSCPDGIAVPPVVQRAVDEFEREAPSSPLDRYQDIRPMQYSNGGGVYSALRIADRTKVVLKEARPHAGLDFRGRDAITRLRIEREVLIDLAKTGVAPQLNDWFTAWEHEFIEMEFVDGTPLNSWVAMNYPFRADEDRGELGTYTGVALNILQNLIDAVEKVHAAGRVLGDLHPANVIVGEDHQVRIIDHEDGRRPADVEPPSFNAVGFRAPEGTSPTDADWFAASRIAMMLFQVQSAMEILAPDYWNRMIEIVERDFGVSAARAVDAVSNRVSVPAHAPLQLRPGVPVAPWPHAPSAMTGSVEDLIVEICHGIGRTREDATSRRRFPGDIAQSSALGTLNVRSGAAGILMALHRAGYEVGVEDRDWLTSHATSALDSDALGLFSGLSGVACVLHELGREDIAARLIDAVKSKYRRMKRLDLHSGLAGIGLSMLSLAQSGHGAVAEDIASDVADVLAARIDAPEEPAKGLEEEPGLFFGWSGVSVFFASYARFRPENARFQELAGAALRRDLRFTSEYGRGIVGLQDQAVNRSLPYLARGSAGVLYTTTQVPGVADSHTLAGLEASCHSRYYAMSGLYNGTAGIVAALSSLASSESISAQRDRLVRNLWDYALSWNGSLQFAGENYLRLSADFGTGAAGILTALVSTQTGRPAWLPTAGASVSAPAFRC